ncbi:RNA splicing factor [Lithospermum erythrorhizon]|uniref:RNA splicing factor n=1 Tax=Lithospermum erythrorhizon TaxID=34254 RepID=A0AAV3QUD3_LITER
MRSLSPVVRRELENSGKAPDSRKLAMEVLKSYVKGLDLEAIPLFLAQVSETKESGLAGEYTISLYEVRLLYTKLVQRWSACSKVVPAIARYVMDPTTPEDEKRYIIHSLSMPLSDSLLVSQESLSSGAAMCLKALVECGNWRFASSETVNEVCQRVVGSLEKHTQTNSHMALVMALPKHNSLIVEAYASNQSIQGSLYDNKSVNRKLWPRHENGGVDATPEDEILSEAIHASGSREYLSDEFSFEHEDCTEDFEGFSQGSDAVGCFRSATPSPQIITPQMLMRSLQEYSDGRSSTDDEQFQSSTESVCSTSDIPTCTNAQILSETRSAHVTKPRYIQRVLLFLSCIDDQEVGYDSYLISYGHILLPLSCQKMQL